MGLFLGPTKASRNFLLDVSRGVYDNMSIIHKFGANFDIDTGTTPESVWTGGGLYPWGEFDTAQTLYCISTSASDTETMTIQGLDENYDPQSETVTLTGTSAVATTNTFIRIFRMQYNHSDGNSGTITARVDSGTGAIVAQIDATFGQTLMAIYTVPAGHTGYLMCGDMTINAFRDVQLKFFVREFGTPFRIAHMAETRGAYRYDFPLPVPIPEKSDLDVRIDDVSLSNSRCTANFDLLLIKSQR